MDRIDLALELLACKACDAVRDANRRGGIAARSCHRHEHPDLTLVEMLAELRKRRIRTSRSALWRFLDRHNITFKKKPASY